MNFNDSSSKDPLDEDDSEALGNNLPGDEDDLLAGLTDDFDLSGLPSQLEEMEDYDLFGMEMESESQESLLGMSMSNMSLGGDSAPYPLPNGTAAATVVGEHPFGEHPSRTLFVRNINSNVEDSELKLLFEVSIEKKKKRKKKTEIN